MSEIDKPRKQRLRTLEAQIREKYEAALRHEYDGPVSCFWCGRLVASKGHAEDCPLARALAGGG